MAVDREAMRQKMREQLLERTKKGTSKRGGFRSKLFKEEFSGDLKFFSCKDGDHIVDIIPYFAGDEDPLVEAGKITYNFSFYIHRNIGPTGDQVVLCPLETFGEPCPICEHVKVLKKEGAAKTTWQPLTSKPRTLYNVICYDSEKEEQKGVQIWDVSYFYMEKHLAKLARGPMQRGGKRGGGLSIEPNIPFADIEEGRSICFSVDSQGRDYPEYSAHQFEKRDYVIEDDILAQVYVFDGMVYKPTYEEIYSIYWGESPDGEQSEEFISQEKKEVKQPSKTVRKKEVKEEVQEEEIQEEVKSPSKSKSTKTFVCPHGANFGADANEYEECDDCKIWEDCVAAQTQSDKPEEDQPEEDPEEVIKPRKRKETTETTSAKTSPTLEKRRRRVSQ